MSGPETSNPADRVLATIAYLTDRSEEQQGQRVNRRSKDRKPLALPCQAFFFVESSDKTTTLSGRTRNISNNGLSVVLKRCFHRDEPIEIRIDVPGRRPLNLAGLTRFCRYISGGFFEIGVELMAADDTPVFAADPGEAVFRLPWLAEAIQRRGTSAYGNRTVAKRDRLMR